MLFQLEQSQWLPPTEITLRQNAQVAKLLQHAINTVPYYQKKYKQWLHQGMLLNDDRWQQLPLLQRHEIQSHFEQLRSTKIPGTHGKIVTYASSGSSGRPIQVLGTETTHFYWLVLGLRDHLWHRRDLSKKHAAIRTKVDKSSSMGWGEWADSIACGPSATLSIRTDIEAQFDWLVAEAPEYLITHPSNLLALVKHASHRGLRPESLREVRTFGEMLRPGLREQVRADWGIPLNDIYSAEEVGYIALQCPESENYHIQAENLLVEILREDGTPCQPGETGMMVVTTLHNFAMPLIRYRLMDYVEVGEPCPCGRGLPVIRRIIGRQRNMLILPDGREFWPSFPGSAWRAVAPVQQFQLVQTELDHIEVKLVCARPLSPLEEAGLSRMLTELLDYPLRFSFRYLDQIETNPNHKFEDFISLVPQQKVPI